MNQAVNLVSTESPAHPFSTNGVIDFALVKEHVTQVRWKHQIHAQRHDSHPSTETWLAAKTTDSNVWSSPFSYARELSLNLWNRCYGKACKTKHNRAAGETVSVPLTNANEELWYGVMNIGEQKFKLQFDTGSSDIILNKSSYKPGKSANDTGESFKIGYDDSSRITGKIYTDTLSVGSITLKDVPLGVANDDPFESIGIDGVAGMGFLLNAQTHRDPFFDLMMSAKVLKENVFTFTVKDEGSQLLLGGIPPEVEEMLVYVDVNSSKGFWNAAGVLNGQPINAIHDSGSTIVIAPKSFAKTFFANLGLQTIEQEGVLYGLYHKGHHPKMEFTFGAFKLRMSAETVFLQKYDDKRNVMSLVGSGSGTDGLTIGDSWYRNVVAVFSRQEEDKPKIGFAAQ